MIVANATHPYARTSPVASAVPIVFVVDEDLSMRETLAGLIQREGWQPETFAAADAFLSRPGVSVPSCLVLAATLPSIGALAVQRRVAAERPATPVIVTTDRGDVAMTVQAMKAGATEVFLKPLDRVALVHGLRQSIARSVDVLKQEAERQALRDRYAALSSREREVMSAVVAGRLNKQVGGDLGISEITVKAHRGRVMGKMQARSFVDLVHMAIRLGIARDGSSDRLAPDAAQPGLPH